MVRQHTPLLGRASPLNATSHKSSHTINRIPEKSPIISRAHLLKARRANAKARPILTSRFSKSPSTLPTIHESLYEDDEDEQKDAEEPRFDSSRDLHHAIDALVGRENGRGGRIQESEDEDMEWDEETTLVAILQDNTEQDQQEELNMLAEQLRAPISAEGAKLRKYLADTVLPVVSQVKEVHAILEDKVDMDFASGILQFNEACKKMELMAIQDEDEVKAAYINSQKSMRHLIVELREAYKRRDQLWTAVEADLNTCAEQAAAALEMLPSQLEHTIALSEKKSKELEKNTSQVNKQKILKELLEKL